MAAIQETTMLHQGSEIHYLTYGRGSEAMLTFHGYGQTGMAFLKLEKLQPGKYTYYCFDLFYHGKSIYDPSHPPLPVDTWSALVASFLDKNNIESFSMMGYSLGARFVLTLLPDFYHAINQIILIAPDGITMSPWYKMATGNKMGRKVFYWIMRKPKPILILINIFAKLQLMDKYVLKFVGNEMNSMEKRFQVYNVWTMFRYIFPDVHQSIEILNHENIMVILFMGQYDKIVKEKHILSFNKKINTRQYFKLSTGHNGILSAALSKLKENKI